MITFNLSTNEYIGLSTDDKPVVDVENGSTFFEMDTEDKYYFDEEHSEWIKPGATNNENLDDA